MIVRKICLGLAVLIAGSLNAMAASYSVVCEVAPGTDVNKVAGLLRGTSVEEIFDNMYVLSLPNLPSTALPQGVIYCEANTRTTLPRFGGAVFSVRGDTSSFWYRGQPALTLIKTDRAQTISKGRGIVIADINSAVDYSHPALRGVLTSGHDFVADKQAKTAAGSLNQATASFLDQATASFLDQATASFLDQATASFLDQATASFLDTSSPAHGHGTMVAGVLAAVAPESMIMPLRAFDDSGQADLSDIIKAIRYAMRNGAQVINMSFGVSKDSKALDTALQFAITKNVVLVASAGNDNTDRPQYPAGYADVIAVAATDINDRKASFSNYGLTIDVAAPGVNIVSSYPGGYYAVVSGTSFSAPIVAAEAALLLWEKPSVNADSSIEKGAVPLNSQYKLGAGRVDLYQSVLGVQ